MNVDYATLDTDILSGLFRQTLEEELTVGFRLLQLAGERLPVASYYATKIAEIVDAGADEPLHGDLKFHVYQEILAAVEAARARVLADPVPPPA
jgi:hypothetical protein